MPFNPSSPESGEIRTVTNVSLDTYHLKRIEIDYDPNEENGITVHINWSIGAMVDSEYVESVTMRKAFICDTDVISKVNQETLNNETVYDAVKRTVYEVLQEKGLIPEGAIS